MQLRSVAILAGRRTSHPHDGGRIVAPDSPCTAMDSLGCARTVADFLSAPSAGIYDMGECPR